MPSSKLYLIRRDLENFTGPVTPSELARAMERMSVGLRDEVSGHCGPWVFLDDREKLKKFYPELVILVQSKAVSGWSADVGVFRNEPTVKGPVSLPKSTPDRRWLMAAAFFGLALFAATVAWFLAGSGELSSRIVGAQMQPASDLAALLVPGREKEFLAVMEPQINRIIEKTNRKREIQVAWLPYLRAFAFAGAGEIPGFAAKKLRGDAGVAAPADCSVKAWTQRWREGAPLVKAMIAGTQLPSDHWGRILAWDPWWIDRRIQKGWIAPRNFYQACLATAGRALDAMEAFENVSPIRERLNFLVSGGVRDSESNPVGDSTVLGLWTCMDRALNRLELDKCLEAPWQALMENDYNREKFYWSVLRLAVKARSSGSQSEWDLLRDDLEAFLAGRDQSDSYTRLDYSGELASIGAVRGKLPVSVDAPISMPAKSPDGDIQVEVAH